MDQYKTPSITILSDDSKAMEGRRRLFISYFVELLNDLSVTSMSVPLLIVSAVADLERDEWVFEVPCNRQMHNSC